MTETIDIQIPGYKVLRQLGRGGMASVYLAIQESMEREVALKILLPSLAEADPSFGERFVREAKIVAKLSHPNINAVIDVGVAGKYHYFSMEYITGGDLRARIRQGLSPKMALVVARQIVSALDAAHAKGYVHRDVKPENVLFRENGTAVLTDFGIAKARNVATQMTSTGTVIGTPSYMSPEQAKGHEVDCRSDLYSLGVMFFEMLTGGVPYSGDSAVAIALKHVTEPIPRLPPALDMYQPLLEKLLAKEPAQRYQSGREAAAMIDRYINATPVPGTASAPVGVDRTIVMGPANTTSQTVATNAAKSHRGRWAVLALVVPAAIASVYFWSWPAASPTADVPPTPVASVPAPVVRESAPVQPERKEEAPSLKVTQMLAQAEAAVRATRYFEPPETAAVPLYRSVLTLDPGNAVATRGLNEIAGRLITQAERAIENRRWDDADALLRQAEMADSTHPMLFSRRLGLKEYRQQQLSAASERRVNPPPRVPPETQAKPSPPTVAPSPPVALPTPAAVPVEDLLAREQRAREQKLQALLARFDDLVAPGSLSSARAELALDLISEVTKLAPSDARASALPGRLADAYLSLANVRASEKDYVGAETFIQRGLDIVPGHKRLLQLRTEVAEKKNPKRPTFGSF